MSSEAWTRPYHIFISRVSGEFGKVAGLAADLRAKGMIGKLQVDFRQEENTETTLDKLEQYIREADAVIALIGQRSGAYPPDTAAAKWAHVLPEGIERATYTQWEVHFARHYRRRLSFYFGFDHAKDAAHYAPENPAEPATDDLPGQNQYALWLTKTLGIDRNYFTSEDNLCRLVLKEAWPIEIMAGPAVGIHPEDLEMLILHFDQNIDLFDDPAAATPDVEGEGDRKKIALLKLVERLCEEKGIQYIMSAIRHELPRNPDDSLFAFKPGEVVRGLHDNGDEGRLFRVAVF